MTILSNGRIVTPEAVLKNMSLVVENDRILSILADKDIRGSSHDQLIDVGGAYILPGLIDIHSDYIERIAAPRPTSLMDFSLALRVAERELLTHGITTMYHSLSFYKDGDFGHNPIRKPHHTSRLMELIHTSHHKNHLLHHRFHARFELDSTDRVEELRSYLREGKIHLLSFMDHTPGQGQFRDLAIYRKTLKGYVNLSDIELDGRIEEIRLRQRLTTIEVAELAKLALDCGVALASHDDDCNEKLELVQSFGSSISEFPITLEIARTAGRMGMHTVAGAPNILLGGSHSGNLSAAEAILDGSVDILCSDYYPAALLHSLFYMHKQYSLPLHKMVNLATLNAAKAVGTAAQTGSLEPGKMADLLLVKELDEAYPAVIAVFVSGQNVMEINYRS